MSKNPGFRDVAKCARVSVTTVERVLNERGSVSPETREKVLKAASELGLRRVLPLRDYGNLRIETILPTNPTQYWAKLSSSFKQAGQHLPRGIVLHRTFVPENDPSAIIRAVTQSSLKRSALIIAAELDSDIAQSLRKILQQGEVLVFVSTRTPSLPNQAFSGIDNIVAGRTAATLVNFAMREKSARVLVLQGNTILQSHRDRVQGFRETLSVDHACEIVITREKQGASLDHLSKLVQSDNIPDAIYETGDSGDEIGSILKQINPKPIWIGHERNDIHDTLMRERILDFVIDQDPYRQATWALKEALIEMGIQNSEFSHVEKPELRVFCESNL